MESKKLVVAENENERQQAHSSVTLDIGLNKTSYKLYYSDYWHNLEISELGSDSSEANLCYRYNLNVDSLPSQTRSVVRQLQTCFTT